MSLQTQFLNLVTLFHLDTDDLALERHCTIFVASVAQLLHDMPTQEVKLCLVHPDAVERFRGAQLLLKSYGFTLTTRLRNKKDAVVIGIRPVVIDATPCSVVHEVRLPQPTLEEVTEEVHA